MKNQQVDQRGGKQKSVWGGGPGGTLGSAIFVLTSFLIPGNNTEVEFAVAGVVSYAVGAALTYFVPNYSKW